MNADSVFSNHLPAWYHCVFLGSPTPYFKKESIDAQPRTKDASSQKGKTPWWNCCLQVRMWFEHGTGAKDKYSLSLYDVQAKTEAWAQRCSSSCLEGVMDAMWPR